MGAIEGRHRYTGSLLLGWLASHLLGDLHWYQPVASGTSALKFIFFPQCPPELVLHRLVLQGKKAACYRLQLLPPELRRLSNSCSASLSSTLAFSQWEGAEQKGGGFHLRRYPARAGGPSEPQGLQ